MLKQCTVYTIQKRYWQSTLMQSILVPALSVIFLYIIQEASVTFLSATNSSPPAVPLKGVPRCTVSQLVLYDEFQKV